MSKTGDPQYLPSINTRGESRWLFCEGFAVSMSSGNRRSTIQIMRSAGAIILLFLVSCIRCFSADIVLIRSVGGSSSEQSKLEVATDFYGVNLRVITASADNTTLILGAIQESGTAAVAIEASALADVGQEALLGALHRKGTSSVPLLIFGVTPETNRILLSRWSGGAAIGVGSLTRESRLQYVVGDVKGLTQQLTDLEIPFPSGNTFYFRLGGGDRAQTILAVRDDHQTVPQFIEQGLRKQEVFLLCETSFDDERVVEGNTDSVEDAFGKVAAEMIFVRHVSGERGWHAPHHYANLTIDDPWLREPYGNLSYVGLLKEMEKHKFHTTIAFIPWNYDRSEAGTVSLFRSHPDKFSICIHGDDHAHKEFTGFKDVPLDIQGAALRQSLARMERFQALTEIPYDKVMVFPHSIAPEKTIETLKALNYLATINSQNVPMDAVAPKSILFTMRPTTLSFGGFPSILRYPVVEPTHAYRLAIDDFLDNPLFFYAHEDYFGTGIDAFDGIADEVNRLEPDTNWRGAGDIVKHLYMVRLRDDSNFDVIAMAGTIDLENTTTRDAVFFVRKPETGSPPINSVSLDGKSFPFQLLAGYLELRVPIPAGETRSIEIQYKNDLNLASVNPGHSSLRAYCLRRISDFRDITVSRFRVGRSIIDLYNSREVGPEFLIAVMCACGLIICCTIGSWKLTQVIRKRDAAQEHAAEQ
jgi:hypothetical protein